jgi:hypothetical protein
MIHATNGGARRRAAPQPHEEYLATREVNDFLDGVKSTI